MELPTPRPAPVVFVPPMPTRCGPCHRVLPAPPPPPQLPCPFPLNDLNSSARSNLPACKNNLRAINGKEHLSEKPDDFKALMDTFVTLSQEELMSHKLALGRGLLGTAALQH